MAQEPKVGVSLWQEHHLWTAVEAGPPAPVVVIKTVKAVPRRVSEMDKPVCQFDSDLFDFGPPTRLNVSVIGIIGPGETTPTTSDGFDAT